MKISLLAAALAVLPAATTAVDWPKFFRGADPQQKIRGSVTVLSDLEGDGVQPGYCDGAPGNPDTTDDDKYWGITPDRDCWESNDGYPKCCSKNKGTCPYGTPPACDDGSTPSGGGGRDGERCNRDSDCRSDEYCQKDVGDCNSSSDGFCERMPTNCNNKFDEVCGCNNRNYDNECEANADGQNLKYDDGPC